MKNILIVLLSFLFTGIGCGNSEKLILTGKLDKKFESQFLLKQEGDKFSGYFVYKDKPKDKIEVQGVKSGTNLRMEEFNNDDNRLTGIFEGTFDGESYKGFWTDPQKKKRVPFLYQKKLAKQEQDKTLEKKSKIEFIAFDPTFKNSPFYNGLKAEIGGKSYNIIQENDSYGMYIKIVDVRDFDMDGYLDALIEETCGGTACPHNSLFFCYYRESTDKFIKSDPFGSISDDPIIEKWKGKWSVQITSYSAMEMYEAEERYILKNGEPIQVEYHEKAPVKTIVEMHSEDFSAYEKTNNKTIRYDLDGDGENDSIIGTYWDRWNSINWEVRFSNGKSYRSSTACLRIGVLSSKTRNVHDLVCGLNSVFVWNGEKYVEKN